MSWGRGGECGGGVKSREQHSTRREERDPFRHPRSGFFLRPLRPLGYLLGHSPRLIIQAACRHVSGRDTCKGYLSTRQLATRPSATITLGSTPHLHTTTLRDATTLSKGMANGLLSNRCTPSTARRPLIHQVREFQHCAKSAFHSPVCR